MVMPLDFTIIYLLFLNASYGFYLKWPPEVYVVRGESFKKLLDHDYFISELIH